MSQPNPMQLSKIEAKALTIENVLSIKRPDCNMYNDCLTMASKGGWKGFGCSACTAYQVISLERRLQDNEGLEEALCAAKNVEEEGNAGRKRGVKAGADNKRCALAIVPNAVDDEDDDEDEENSVAC